MVRAQMVTCGLIPQFLWHMVFMKGAREWLPVGWLHSSCGTWFSWRRARANGYLWAGFTVLVAHGSHGGVRARMVTCGLIAQFLWHMVLRVVRARMVTCGLIAQFLWHKVLTKGAREWIPVG
jgi:hypothetical protein